MADNREMVKRWLYSARVAEKEMDPRSFVAHYPKEMATLGIIGAVIFTGCSLYPLLDKELMDSVWWIPTGLFSLLALFCLVMVFTAFRWQIIVDNDQMKIRPVFGRIRDIHLTEIYFVQEANGAGIQGIKAYSLNGQRLFAIDAQVIGFAFIYDKLKPLLIQDAKPELRFSWGVTVFLGIITVCCLAFLISAMSSADETSSAKMAMVIPFVISLSFTLHLALYRATLTNSTLKILHLFRGKRSIPVSQLKVGRIMGDISFKAFTLTDPNGKTVITVRDANMKGYASFVEELRKHVPLPEGL